LFGKSRQGKYDLMRHRHCEPTGRANARPGPSLRAKRRSPDGVTLLVNADNFRAIRFYERNGFVHAGEDVNPGSKRPVLKMAWKR